MKKPVSKVKLRIIGGQWRGRKFAFPAIPGLRPTPDRIRETLFNWLAPYINGARCLDLFAGSGALGLEALSRGAAHVDFFDAAPAVITHLKAIFQTLQITNSQVRQAIVPTQLPAACPQPYDIVFLDPPFHQNLIGDCCFWLQEHHWLSPNALIYLEAEKTAAPLILPENWQLLKNAQAGQVNCSLCRTS